MQAHPEASNPATGPTVPWTSGLIGHYPAAEKVPQQVCPSAALWSAAVTFCAKVHLRLYFTLPGSPWQRGSHAMCLLESIDSWG